MPPVIKFQVKFHGIMEFQISMEILKSPICQDVYVAPVPMDVLQVGGKPCEFCWAQWNTSRRTITHSTSTRKVEGWWNPNGEPHLSWSCNWYHSTGTLQDFLINAKCWSMPIKFGLLTPIPNNRYQYWEVFLIYRFLVGPYHTKSKTNICPRILGYTDQISHNSNDRHWALIGWVLLYCNMSIP